MARGGATLDGSIVGADSAADADVDADADADADAPRKTRNHACARCTRMHVQCDYASASAAASRRMLVEAGVAVTGSACTACMRASARGAPGIVACCDAGASASASASAPRAQPAADVRASASARASASVSARASVPAWRALALAPAVLAPTPALARMFASTRPESALRSQYSFSNSF